MKYCDRYYEITVVLRSLHYLTEQLRLICYKSQNALEPKYISHQLNF